TINPTTGAATLVGAGPFSPTLSGASFGVGFNPVADRLRVVSDVAQNLRINVDSLAVTVDSALAYAPADPSAGNAPTIVAAGYTNHSAGASATTLYEIDSNLDILVRQGGLGGTPSPNGGQLFTVSPLGVNTQDAAALAIAPAGNQAFAALTLVGETT